MTDSIRKVPGNLLQGQAGVWRVASELALRGLLPHFPGVDFGYDLMIDGGIRIDVKCAHLSMRKPYTNGAYWFHLRKSPIVTGFNTIRRRDTQIFSCKCDFVILFGIEQSKFWIVPAAILDAVQCCVVGEITHGRSKYVECDAGPLQRDREAGLTYEQIAAKYGLTRNTVQRRIMNPLTRTDRRIHEKAQLVRQHENRWDLIEAYLNTMEEAEGIVSLPSPVDSTPQEQKT